MASNERRRSRLAGVAMAVLALAAVCVALPAPASAQPSTPATQVLDTRWTNLAAASWIGADGRTYTITDYLDADADLDAHPPQHVVVQRLLADGTGDPTWGTYDGVDGLRLIAGPWTQEGNGGLSASTALLAASDDGTVALSWPAICDGTLCGRWYLRITGDGNQLAAPVRVPTAQAGGRSLPDATFLEPAGAGTTSWRDGDGTELDLLPLAYPDIVGATVDSSGRLLLSTTAGRLMRKPTDGPADLDIAIDGCADPSQVGVGRSASGDIFATICNEGHDVPLTVQRRSAAGVVEWTATPHPDDPSGFATSFRSALVDAQDRVWVGAVAVATDQVGNGYAAFLQAFTTDGPTPIAYQRPAWRYSKHEGPNSPGVADLRPGPGDSVLATDTFRCCFGNGFTSADHTVIATLAQPADEAPPRCVPTDLAIAPTGGTSASATFTGCTEESISYLAPTGYEIAVSSSSGTETTIAVPETTPGASYQLSVPATAGELTEVAVTASNGAGPNPDEQDTITADTVTPFPTVEAFVRRQLTNLRGTPPTNLTVNDVAAAIRSGTSPLDLIDTELEAGRAGQVVEPVARLYRAYFLRLPDPAGLAYWVAAREAGRGLHTISESFARSPEFRAYGTLTNRQYVDALYQNIFGRPSDPQGLTYWTNKLDTRKTGRGKVVLQFSESPEGKSLMAPYVEPLATSWLMLGRVPTVAEAATWQTTANPHRDVAATILATSEYAARAT